MICVTRWKQVQCALPNRMRSRPTGWRVNPWGKARDFAGGFGWVALEEMNGKHPDGGSILSFVDKGTYPARRFTAEAGIRIVPGGSSVRSGAFLAKGVVMMPPAYVNVGAFVDEGTMIDSHALVGSCAQIGKRVHLSAAAQIGGVLEPVNASPVIIEDDALIGGNTGRVRRDDRARKGCACSWSDPDARHTRLRLAEQYHSESDGGDAVGHSSRCGGSCRARAL